MRVFSYWTGPVTWMERLSIASAIATGHQLTIFTDDPAKLRGERLGVVIEDAREVFDDTSLGDLKTKKPDHFSDHFRLEGLAKRLGVWVDLDLVFLKKLPDDDHLLGWQEPDIICNAVLLLPAESEMLGEYLTIVRKRPVSVAPPWLPLSKRLRIRLKHAEQKLWGRRGVALPYGPVALTYLGSKYEIEGHVLPPEAFYPVHWSSVADLFRQDTYRPTDNTFTIHLWRNYCTRWLASPQPMENSYLRRLQCELGVR